MRKRETGESQNSYQPQLTSHSLVNSSMHINPLQSPQTNQRQEQIQQPNDVNNQIAQITQNNMEETQRELNQLRLKQPRGNKQPSDFWSDPEFFFKFNQMQKMESQNPAEIGINEIKVKYDKSLINKQHEQVATKPKSPVKKERPPLFERTLESSGVIDPVKLHKEIKQAQNLYAFQNFNKQAGQMESQSDRSMQNSNQSFPSFIPDLDESKRRQKVQKQTIYLKKFEYLPSFHKAEEELKENVNHLRNRFLLNALKVQQNIKEMQKIEPQREIHLKSYSSQGYSRPQNPYLREVLAQNILNQNTSMNFNVQNNQTQPNTLRIVENSKFFEQVLNGKAQPTGYSSILEKYNGKNIYQDVILKELHNTRQQLHQLQQRLDNQGLDPFQQQKTQNNQMYTIAIPNSTNMLPPLVQQPYINYQIPEQSFNMNSSYNSTMATDRKGNMDYKNFDYDQKLESLFGKVQSRQQTSNYHRTNEQFNSSQNQNQLDGLLPSRSTLVSFHSNQNNRTFQI
eukprot:403338403